MSEKNFVGHLEMQKRLFEITSRRLITQSTEEFSSDVAEAKDFAKFPSHAFHILQSVRGKVSSLGQGIVLTRRVL
jgi:hypothetical protein